jgi:hypothetical protein
VGAVLAEGVAGASESGSQQGAEPSEVQSLASASQCDAGDGAQQHEPALADSARAPSARSASESAAVRIRIHVRTAVVYQPPEVASIEGRTPRALRPRAAQS